MHKHDKSFLGIILLYYLQKKYVNVKLCMSHQNLYVYVRKLVSVCINVSTEKSLSFTHFWNALEVKRIFYRIISIHVITIFDYFLD